MGSGFVALHPTVFRGGATNEGSLGRWSTCKHYFLGLHVPLKSNISPENQWLELEDVFPIQIVGFLGAWFFCSGVYLSSRKENLRFEKRKNMVPWMGDMKF